nr:P27 family phage terminase small subunit [Peribacillus kribbensis]
MDRYIDLVKSFRWISKIISKEGETIVTENGKQKFLKAHPLIGERNKINASLLSIEKSFGQKLGDDDPDDKRKTKYNASDLI